MLTLGSYLNEFLYVVIRSEHPAGSGDLVYCSGVNITRFSAITRGLHGLSSNPAIRGLQMVKHGVSSLALSQGATPRNLRGKDCTGLAPTADTWYSEILRIENAPSSLPGQIVPYAVLGIVEKILTGCCLKVEQPVRLPEPAELQEFLSSLRR